MRAQRAFYPHSAIAVEAACKKVAASWKPRVADKATHRDCCHVWEQEVDNGINQFIWNAFSGHGKSVEVMGKLNESGAAVRSGVFSTGGALRRKR